MPADNKKSPAAKSTVQQERDAKREAKVAEIRRAEAHAKRNRRIALGSILGGVGLVVVLVIVFVVTGRPSTPVSAGSPAPSVPSVPQVANIDGLQTFIVPPPQHVTTPVTYPQNPPAGGNHFPVWLNCGIYDQPVPNEKAVHDLEHGAVWVTYDASLITGDALTKLRTELPGTYIVLSPYDGLPSPVVASAWGAQIQLTGVDDPRLQQFLDAYWQSPKAPEPGGACTGGLDAPGLVTL